MGVVNSRYFTNCQTTLTKNWKYKLNPTELPENTLPRDKLKQNFLYQFLDFPTRYIIDTFQMAQHLMPSQENHLHYLDELKRYSDENSEQEILSIQAFACHGMIKRGEQVVVANNYDTKNRFYELIEAESNIRFRARRMPKIYFIVLFACCREFYNGM